MAFESRLALFYACIYAALGIQLPFLPLWLAARGLDQGTIGLLLSVSALMRMVSVPLIARATDHLNSLRMSLILASGMAAAASVLLGLAGNVTLMFATFAASAAAVTAIFPLADTYALKGLAARGRPYGATRLWGSAAFIVGTMTAGLLSAVIPAGGLIWPIVAGLAATACAAFWLMPVTLDAPAPTAAKPRIAVLLTSPVVLMVAAASGLIQASHAMYYAFSALDWTSAGLAGLVIGLLWSIGVMSEIALFAMASRLPVWISPVVLIMLGAGGATLRWAVMAFDPPLALLPVLQALHGLSFGMTYLGSVLYMARAAPAGLAASAQGVLAMINGAIAAAAMSAAGFLHARYGVGAYAAMATMAAAGGVLALSAAWRFGAHRDA